MKFKLFYAIAVLSNILIYVLAHKGSGMCMTDTARNLLINFTQTDYDVLIK